MKEVHKSITEEGSQPENVLVSADPQETHGDFTEKGVPVGGVSGNH